MTYRTANSCLGVGLAVLLAIPSGAASAQNPALSSFFDAVAQELETKDVFALDGASLGRVLISGLGWTVSEEEVEAALGSRFRIDPLFLFLACEAETSCVLAVEGSHAELTRASVAEDTGQVELWFALSRTEERREGVLRERLIVRLMEADGAWQVVGGANPKAEATRGRRTEDAVVGSMGRPG